MKGWLPANYGEEIALAVRYQTPFHKHTHVHRDTDTQAETYTPAHALILLKGAGTDARSVGARAERAREGTDKVCVSNTISLTLTQSPIHLRHLVSSGALPISTQSLPPGMLCEHVNATSVQILGRFSAIAGVRPLWTVRAHNIHTHTPYATRHITHPPSHTHTHHPPSTQHTTFSLSATLDVCGNLLLSQ